MRTFTQKKFIDIKEDPGVDGRKMLNFHDLTQGWPTSNHKKAR
jgi:hypothetical protein